MWGTQEVGGEPRATQFPHLVLSLCPFGPWGELLTVRSGPWWSQVTLLSSCSRLDCAASTLMPTGVTAQRGTSALMRWPPAWASGSISRSHRSLQGSPRDDGRGQRDFPFKREQKVFWPEHTLLAWNWGLLLFWTLPGRTSFSFCLSLPEALWPCVKWRHSSHPQEQQGIRSSQTACQSQGHTLSHIDHPSTLWNIFSRTGDYSNTNYKPWILNLSVCFSADHRL